MIVFCMVPETSRFRMLFLAGVCSLIVISPLQVSFLRLIFVQQLLLFY